MKLNENILHCTIQGISKEHFNIFWMDLYINITSTYFYGLVGGGSENFLSILIRGRGEEMFCFNISPYLVTLLERYTFQKHHNA